MNREIEVTIGPKGDVTIEAKNFSGPGCEKATRALEEALGTVKSRKQTGDYHKRPGQAQSA